MAATPKKPAAKKNAAPVKSQAAKDAAPARAAGGGELRSQFEVAAVAAKQTKKRPDNATLLKLYSYYKQATDGDVSGARPGAFDFVAGAKYDAWSKLKGMSADDAMKNYIKQVERLNRDAE